jgi:predicted transport protein
MWWTCPACGREFGRRQSHVCVPARSVDSYFAERPAVEREIFEAVREHLESLGPVIVEPVGVGILFKRRRTFVELRPKARWVDLSIGLNHRLDHPRITRTVRTGGVPTYHGIRIRSAADIDSEVCAWLTESYTEFAGSD